MPRCDSDTMFYRICCALLIGSALTFTVILTNVFVDIDDVITGKGRVKNHVSDDSSQVAESMQSDLNKLDVVDNSEDIYNDMKNPEHVANEDVAYRVKRSLESTNIKFRIKIPENKQRIITDRLATLLEELDAEEADLDSNNIVNAKNQPEKQNSKDRKYFDAIKDKIDHGESENDLTHLAMHNILLRGLIGHMNLNDVYKKVYALAGKTNKGDSEGINKVIMNERSRYNVESKLFDEQLKCGDLQKAIAENDHKNIAIEREPKTLIETVIDIKDKNKENDINSKENIVGAIKLIYNGKPVRVNQVEDQQKDATDNKNGDTRKANDALAILKNNIEYLPQQFLNDAVIEYLNKHPNSLQPKYENKRLKRNVHKSHGSSAPKIKVKENKKSVKKNEEELYVEIETHFDSKGMNGEKKRKLVKDIIHKIRKAIHDDVKNVHEVKKKPKHFLIKKRVQNPLIAKLHVATKPVPREKPQTAIALRQTDSLSKIYSADTEALLVDGREGNTWQNAYSGPQFLSPTKGINAAELGEINIRYDITSNGISQRLQQPLNADIDDENATSFYKLGNLKFFIKEIDGTGFAIGFNQYFGEPPDEQSMKTFTGIDNLIKAYRNQEYSDVVNIDKNEYHDSDENSELHKRETRNTRKHSIVRRSVEENNDYHSNEYKIIFNNNFLPYDSYKEIFEDRSKKVQISVNRDTSHELELINKITEDTISKDKTNKHNLEKELRPSEIFRLANLLGRRKRSIKVQKYLNLNTRSKLNRYLNTNTKGRGRKRILLKKNRSRNKRQTENMRITAADDLGEPNENIFLLAGGDILADRDLVREVELPGNNDQVNEVIPDNYRYMMPYDYAEPNHASYIASLFGGRSRQNSLMSKYPHIFMEEISRSKEDNIPENSFRVNNLEEPQEFPDIYSTTETISPMFDVPGLSLKEIDGSISPNTNYKLTVKILPKNTSVHGMHTGFKEIHTSINKSISKNGILFSSLFNLSEISKVEKVLNKTNEKGSATVPPLENVMKTQQEGLLRQQKNKIDAQINNLNKEKAFINFYQKQDINKTDDVIDVLLPSNPPHIVHLTRKEAGQLITSALMKLKDTPHITDLHDTLATRTTSTNITVTTTIATSTTPKTLVDLDKQGILNSIQNNENLTHKILSKIDKTTEMLHKIFDQLGVKMEPLSDKKNDGTPCRKEEQTIERQNQKLPITYWRDHIQEPFFKRVLNNTQVSIPFVYAYQQPYLLPTNNNKDNIASVIYQGHIHTNAIRRSLESPKLNSSNQTKFFIDSLEDAVKVSHGKNVVYPVKVATVGNITITV